MEDLNDGKCRRLCTLFEKGDIENGVIVHSEILTDYLTKSHPDHICRMPGGNEGYRFSAAMKSPAFISLSDILNKYLPMGFSEFKIEGRGLGSAVLLEFLLYYLTKPEYHLLVREELYLDSMLDLF